jgi:AcrR family transcriptional regulator
MTRNGSTEEAIFRAAEKEFMEKGLEGARTVKIARNAGVTHSMLHYYFRTKEQLFNKIMQDKFRLIVESVLKVLGDESLPLLERIRQGMTDHFDFLVRNPELPRFMINHVLGNPEVYVAFQAEMGVNGKGIILNLQSAIDKAAEQGEIESVDARSLAMDIMALNLFSLLAYQMGQHVLGYPVMSREEFFRIRKEENIETIIKRLRIRL